MSAVKFTPAVMQGTSMCYIDLPYLYRIREHEAYLIQSLIVRYKIKSLIDTGKEPACLSQYGTALTMNIILNDFDTLHEKIILWYMRSIPYMQCPDG